MEQCQLNFSPIMRPHLGRVQQDMIIDTSGHVTFSVIPKLTFDVLASVLYACDN